MLLIKILVVDYWGKLVKYTPFPPDPSTGVEEKIDENIMQTNGLQKKLISNLYFSSIHYSTIQLFSRFQGIGRIHKCHKSKALYKHFW